MIQLVSLMLAIASHVKLCIFLEAFTHVSVHSVRPPLVAYVASLILFFNLHSFSLTFLQDPDPTKCAYSLNMDFSSKRTKLKITTAVQRESPQVWSEFCAG